MLFVDRQDTHAAPMAAALLASYARQRMHVSSAGEVPGAGIDEVVVRVPQLLPSPATAGCTSSPAATRSPRRPRRRGWWTGLRRWAASRYLAGSGPTRCRPTLG